MLFEKKNSSVNIILIVSLGLQVKNFVRYYTIEIILFISMFKRV